MKPRGIIAEIGNNHNGSVEKAKELIRAAKESGATYCKLQAIDPKELTSGSMPYAFYSAVSLPIEDYALLKYYGDEIGIPVFFSIFGKKYMPLLKMFPDMLYKISGSQFRNMDKSELWEFNNPKTIVSVPKLDHEHLLEKQPYIDEMHVLYVTPYLPKAVEFEVIGTHMKYLKRPIGYSDHTVGIDAAAMAIREYGCQLIEVHFHLGEMIWWGGQAFRDCYFSKTPKQLETLVAIYRDEYTYD